MVRDIKAVSGSFKLFGEVYVREMSPYYANLSTRISEDEDILEIASQIPDSQPPPNLLFAAVRYLLDKGAAPHLLERYPVDYSPARFESSDYT